MRRLLAALPVAALLVAVAPSSAQAATYTSSGVRCTKVGTGGADRLTGTSARDVLCGLGGDDVLYGLGGDDVLDGGPGTDTVRGGTGNDAVLGGSGNDAVNGDGGTDKVYGGTGSDRVYGGDGADLLYGQDGGDSLSGGYGADKEYGGIGDDRLLGGPDGDVLAGQDGNDDLSGEGGSDALDGGTGTNWCTVGAADSQTRCVYDATAPKIGSSTVSPNPVDVTNQSVLVTVRSHIVDDTGIARVQFTWGSPTLVSGTVRDGVWQSRAYIPRYAAPGDYTLMVDATDRVGRHVYREVQGALTVNDANPDLAMPVVTGATLSRTSVDVRTASATIGVTARITDDASGVRGSSSYFCVHYPRGDGSYGQLVCNPLTLSSGTTRSGYWKASATIPKGSLGGDWNVSLWVTDPVHEGSANYFWGPDVYRHYADECPSCEDPNFFELPSGRFSVLGTSDNTPASLVGLRTDRTSVDTLPSDQVVHVDAHATDAAGEGVTAVGGYLAPEGGESEGTPGFSPVEGSRISGTVVNGVWRLTLTLPQGTPPGRYCVAQVWVEDKGHWRSYAPASSPFAGQDGQQSLAAGQLTQSDGSAWDGCVTVVQNPSG